MVRTRAARTTIEELKKRIQLAEKAKREYTEYLQKVEDKYARDEISYPDYVETIYQHREGRTIQQWIEYFDYYIQECKKEIREQKKNIIKNQLAIFLFSSILILILIASSVYLRPTLTGLFVQEPEIVPETLIVNATVETTQCQAVLGQAVKWKKVVELEEQGTTKIKLPGYAVNISVNKIISEEKLTEALQNQTSPYQEESLPSSEVKKTDEKQAKFSITGAVISEGKEPLLLKFFRNIRGALTGRAIQEPIQLQEIEINDTATKYEVEYETTAPYAIEEEIARGKRIKLVGPETIHYENVLAFTELDENLNIINPSQVKIHWVEDDSYLPIENIQDKDNNGIYDYVEWIAPVLSEQTFEIIVITKAEHLDANRDFISDIYEEVKELDDVWSETIPDGDYVRVTFEIPLDSSKDITIYPRVVYGNPRIEVYEIGGAEVIAEFTSLNLNDYNKVFLTNLVGSQDTFDLRVLDGDIEIDYIVDPAEEPLHVEDTSTDNDATKFPTESTWAEVLLSNDGDDSYAKLANKNDDMYFALYNSSVGTGTINNVTAKIYVKTGASGMKAAACMYDGTTRVCETLVDPGTSYSLMEYTRTTNVTGGTWIWDDIDNLILSVDVDKTGNPAGEWWVTEAWIVVNYEEVGEDLNIPIFSAFTVYPNNDTPYSSSALNYKFNSTITFTNGTAGIELGGTNYSSTNVSDAHTVSISSLAAGTYNYYWWAYGNGTENKYNQSGIKDYTVAKSTETCGVLFNESSPIDYGKPFLVWSNCTSDFTLYLNSSEIGNNTEQVLGAEFYNFTVTRTDNVNYSNVYEERSFTVSKIAPFGDLTNNESWTENYRTPIEIGYSTNNNGDGGVVYKVYRDSVDKASGETVTLGVGDYDYVLNTTGGANYTANSSMDAETLTISQNPLSFGVFFNESSSVTYGKPFIVWSNCTSDFTLYLNGSSIDNNSEQNLGAGVYNFSAVRTDAVNYSVTYAEEIFVVSKIAPTLTKYLNGTDGNLSITYPMNVNASAYTTGGVVSIYRNETNVTSKNKLDVSLAVGYYEYKFNVTGNQNYTDISGKFLYATISQGTGNVTAYINNSRSNQTITKNEEAYLNATLVTGSGNIKLYYNDSLINQGASPLSNLTNFTSAGLFNVSAIYSGNENYTSDFETWWANVTEVTNAAPTITWVEPIPSLKPVESGTNSTTFNFTVNDPQGASDINVSTAQARFQKSGETTRTNLSCVNWSSDTNNVNFTCTVTMWYYDADANDWTVNVTVRDNSDETGENSSTSLTYIQLISMMMAPTSLGWPEINLTGSNTGSNTDPITINNTGNKANLNINITAYDLQGEQIKTQYIYAANISVENKSEGCSGTATAMSNATSLNITSAILQKGNNSLNYNNATSGQEQIYFCVTAVNSDLSAQSYSSSAFGSWEIKILLVAVIPRGRKKKKQKEKVKKRKKIEDDKLLKALNLIVDELKDEYSLNKKEIIRIIIEKLKAKYNINRKEIIEIIKTREKLNIPITIFSKELGALESLVKYMKENLNMGYSEIAEELNRDERTIWTAYKKATEKMKKPFKIKETEIILPISIFKDKKLTILESTIIYLKEKGMKYSEIAKLLSRDQRNIWTIYSRARKKLHNEK